MTERHHTINYAALIFGALLVEFEKTFEGSIQQSQVSQI